MTHEVNAYDVDGNIIINLVQWDRDVYIYIHDSGIDAVYPMHFYNDRSESAYVVETAYADGVLKAKIPNLLLEQPYSIIGYVYISKDNGYRSIYRTRIKVRPRPMPSDHVYEDTYDYLSLVAVLSECRNYANDSEKYKENAWGYMNNAATQAQNAGNSAGQAASFAGNAANSASEAYSYRESAKNCLNQASSYANDAYQFKLSAENSADNALKSKNAANAFLNSTMAHANKAENAAKTADESAQSAQSNAKSAEDTAARIFGTFSDYTQDMTLPVGMDPNGKLFAQKDPDISGKVDKEEGKSLSTHDYDDSAKAKVDAIPENPKYTDTVYDDTAVVESINQVKADISALQTALIGVEALADEITGVVGA